MSPNRLSLLTLIIVLIASSCESEFDPTAPVGSTPYVICVLNPKDSAQYVRVQRSYVARGNAYDYSTTPDSLYYKPEEIQVSLIRFDTLDGAMLEDPIELSITNEIPKESGLFSQEGHYLFKTTEPIYAEFEYELSVYFQAEDKRVSSRILPLGSRNIKHAFEGEERKTRFTWYHTEDIDYFDDLTPNNHKQLTRFLFVEMGPNDTVNKYIEYFYDYDSFGSMDNDFGEEGLFGDDFILRFIRDGIPVKQDVRRIAIGLDYMIQIPDSTLLVAQNVDAKGSNTIYKQEFNNIKNGGVGLFASQYKLTVFGKLFKREELDSISLGRYTRQLNFADSRGNFHDGE